MDLVQKALRGPNDLVHNAVARGVVASVTQTTLTMTWQSAIDYVLVLLGVGHGQAGVKAGAQSIVLATGPCRKPKPSAMAYLQLCHTFGELQGYDS